MAEISWDDRALSLYLVAASEELLPQIAFDVEIVARSLAPVRVRRTPLPPSSKRGSVGLPGKLKASVTSYTGRDYLGPYADIAALWYGRFMDPPARQIKRLIPFLPSALMITVDGRDYRI